MDEPDKTIPPPIEVPAEALSEEILLAVIESFILREGTDYGREEVSHQSKIQSVRRQLERGDIKLVFDGESESVTFMTARDWEKLKIRQ